MKRLSLAIATVALSAVAMTVNESVSAHLTAVSPYTYWRDVAPIIDARCGRCHTDTSASGLSLLNYQSARGATWTIRQRLIRGHMPPWFAEGPFKAPPPVTARELDILMTWASGGGPEGRPAPRAAHDQATWPIGQPDLILPMPSAFTFATDEGDQVHEVALPSSKIAARSIRAVDLSPGNPAIVRSAEIIAKSPTGDQVLGLWQPGELPALISSRAGYRVPRGATLLVRIRYRRWYGAPASDLSKIGIYFAEPGAKPIETMDLGDAPAQLQRRLEKRSTLVAVRPLRGPSGTWVKLEVIDARGIRQELARIQLDRNWKRRYVFERAVSLPSGSMIEASITPTRRSLWSSLTGEPIDTDGPAAIALEYTKN